jgi:hypothetical protein
MIKFLTCADPNPTGISVEWLDRLVRPVVVSQRLSVFRDEIKINLGQRHWLRSAQTKREGWLLYVSLRIVNRFDWIALSIRCVTRSHIDHRFADWLCACGVGDRMWSTFVGMASATASESRAVSFTL